MTLARLSSCSASTGEIRFLWHACPPVARLSFTSVACMHEMRACTHALTTCMHGMATPGLETYVLSQAVRCLDPLAAQGSQARQRAPSPPSAPFRGPAAEAEWVGSCCHSRNRKMLHTCTSSWTGQERVNPTRCIGYRIRAYRARACLKQCPICKRATLNRYVLAVSEPTPSTHSV